jgi:hypothetical protein
MDLTTRTAPIRRCSKNSMPLHFLRRIERYPHERRERVRRLDSSSASEDSDAPGIGPLACGGGLLTRRREARLHVWGSGHAEVCPRSRLRRIELAAGGGLSVSRARTAYTPSHETEIGIDVLLPGFTNLLLRDKSNIWAAP